MIRHRCFSLAFVGALVFVSLARGFECPELMADPANPQGDSLMVSRLQVTIPRDTEQSFVDSLAQAHGLSVVSVWNPSFWPERSIVYYLVDRAIVPCDTTAAMIAATILSRSPGTVIGARATVAKPVGDPEDVSQEVTPRPATLLTVQPNPFNPSATITYRVETQGMTRVEVFAVTGQRIRELVKATTQPGTHTVVWDGTDGQGKAVSSGVYLVRFTSPSAVVSRRVTLAR
ncbi:MAG TPA: FlgD immunoglobulin-like domain containing protein [Candidatus Latescibacteria bacterium]|nr:FlgD immunoglobulin-like domain containing protein [Candidatus Latescibacterota bacterium]HPK75355.1 FlgD immunoglobulin-like domain containing protein [Candidatus Latescibacterota bacterium]